MAHADRRGLHAVPAGDSVPDTDDMLDRIARGSHEAFSQLYDHFGPAVYGLAKRVVRNPARAEEVTQEVFMQIWQNAAGFDRTRGKAKTWVLTLAHRRAVDAVRHDQAASTREARYDWSPGPDYDHVQEQVERTFEHEQVRRCLDGLTELQREAVTLAYYQGHTYAQVAHVLDQNPATIKTRMRDGLVRLRDCMGVGA
jgi:RNA polymerase sigma-70 factor (ECF subfamily)